MNRKNFLTSLLSFGGLLAAPSIFAKTNPTSGKYGFIHVGHLPKGSPGDWSVIDNKTGKFYKHPNQTEDTDYYILYAHEESGVIGGIVKHRNIGETRPWSEKVDFHLEYRERKINDFSSKISLIPATKQDLIALQK